LKESAGHEKKGRREKFSPAVLSKSLLLLLADLCKALAAIDGTIGLGLKGDLRLAAAAGAHCGKILPGTAGSGLTGFPAGLAPLGLILEAPLSIELLLTGGKHELLATFFAHKRFVFVHVLTLSLIRRPGPDTFRFVLGEFDIAFSFR